MPPPLPRDISAKLTVEVAALWAMLLVSESEAARSAREAGDLKRASESAAARLTRERQELALREQLAEEV